MPCITFWQDTHKACLDSESRALLWHYQLQTKWMGEDRLWELLGYRWRGSYLQRDRNTVWFDAGHFYENGVFQIIFHVRGAKESSTVKKGRKKWTGDEWRRYEPCCWETFHGSCCSGGVTVLGVSLAALPLCRTLSQWIPEPR